MNLKWFYLIFALLINANALFEADIEANIQITGFEYEDKCMIVAESQWDFIQNPNNITIQSWINASISYGSLKSEQAIDIRNKINNSILNTSIKYKYNLVSKPGDALLKHENESAWKVIVDFIGNIEYLKLIKNYSYTSEGKKLFRKDADKLLSRSGTIDDKYKTWNMWQNIFVPLTNEFSNNMQFIQKAAIANGAHNVIDYWELLSEYEGGYTIAKYRWNEISSLHDKIVKFVKTQLAKKYGNSIKKDSLPPHILGSLQGYDWTPLALEVIPYTEITYELRKNLLQKDLVGKNLYKSASRLANATLKHLPEARFFNESNFQGQCPSKLINLCQRGQMRISTCSHPSIANYLSAHKNIAKVLIHQMSEESNSILNFANRYSALEESVSELFGILSASNSWLHALNLINETDDSDNVRIVSLMITALDVLPRLAYYHSADMWRIDLLKNNTLETEDLINSWWQYRSFYEGLTTDSLKLPTFLDDNVIVSNQPYLSKFIGTILAFQIYDYLFDSTEVMISKIDTMPINSNLIKMIQHGCAENWYDVVKQYLKFSDINADPLLSYFTPLEQYIDEYEFNDDNIVSDEFEKNLEKVEDEFQTNFENFIVTTTVKPKNINVSQKIVTKMPLVKNDNDHSLKSENSEKIEISSIKPILNSKVRQNDTQTAEKILTSNIVDSNSVKEEKKYVKGTTKAVWAVSAVLIAVIAIIIIVIFGRRRCRKTPKNRRYV